MKITLLFISCFLFQSAWGQIPPLADVEKRFEEEVGKIKAQRSEKIETLRNNYLAALLRMEAAFRTEGNLDGLQEAREEVQRIDGTKPLRSESLSAHAELRKMQELVAGQLDEYAMAEAKGFADLVAAVSRYAETTSTTLTQQNRIEEAVAWREWARAIPQRPDIAPALSRVEEQVQTVATPAPEDRTRVHPLLQGNPTPFQASGDATFGDRPKAYIFGQEPKASEKRVNMSTPTAQGSGLALASVQLRLVDDENTLNKSFTGWSSYRQKAHVFVPRLQMTPLPGRRIGKSLVVFDLYKKGSGSRREIIRSDMILIPPVEAGQQVVIDAGIYSYETTRVRYTGGYRYESNTADEFNGYIVSVFDETGALILQRTSDRQLDSNARTSLPQPREPEPAPQD